MRKKSTMRFNTQEKKNSMMEIMHGLLKGNEDYINSNIVLNDEKARQDDTVNEIHVYCDFEFGSPKDKELDFLIAKAHVMRRHKED